VIADLWIWAALIAFVFGLLLTDLFVFHRKAHEVSVREAIGWSIVWVAIGLAFGAGVWLWLGPAAGAEYFAGYLIEKALSVDNIFIFALVFAVFGVPARYQHRVLFWGVVGAIAFRAILIVLGAALLHQLHWLLYVFGAILIVTGLKMAVSKETAVHPEQNPVLRLVRRFVPMTTEYHGQSLFVRQGGLLLATPLFATLVVVEATDLIFAVDSIPAIFAVTRDPFIVFASNAFAILGLRSLYFVLANLMHRFKYLKLGLGAILVFAGSKMLLSETAYKVDVWVSLGVIGLILALAIAASLYATRGLERARSRSEGATEGAGASG
jgi:tellurite resistance protein TerC